jgi:imidazoleglycerol phosphate dehydratase HisB
VASDIMTFALEQMDSIVRMPKQAIPVDRRLTTSRLDLSK